MPARSLVTGGAGFIGSHVARHCLALGQEVVVLDDLSGGFRDQVPPPARLVEGSVTDAALVARLFAEHRFDYVYHLAAYAAEGLSHFIRRFNYETNVLGSVHLINEAVKHEVRLFVFASSIAVYGANQLPMTEDLTPRPEDPYGIGKYAVELDLHAAHRLFGLDYVVFRPHNVYGEHQNIGDPYRNVLGIFMNQLLSGRPLTIFGDGSQTRAFSYIDDVAPYIARAVEIPAARNEVINIGGDQPHSVRRLAEVVAAAFGRAADVVHLPPRHEVLHAYPDHRKARRLLGVSPPVSLEDGVARMASWARRVGPRAGRPFDRLEITRHLPASWAPDSS